MTPVHFSVSFLAVIMADDVPGFLELLSRQPGLLNSSATKWNENPLFIAFKHGCLNVFKEITRQKPELAREKDRRGFTVMHLASITGDIAVVKALLQLKIPQLCLLEDNASMIPLQTAAMEGHGEVIRALVLACPSSLERLTSRQETLFHLALNNYQLGAFQVLMEEARKFLPQCLFNILNLQDDEGNTVLHIAAANKFIGIVDLLLQENSTSHVAIEVNSMNQKGLTPLDLHYKNISRDAAAKKVSHILRNAGAQEGRFLSMEIPLAVQLQATERMPQYSEQTLARNNLQLVFYVMLVGASITIICSLPSLVLKDNFSSVVFNGTSLIYGELPKLFYLMAFNTAGFILGMGLIVILLWSFCFRIATLLTAVIIVIIYGLILEENKVLKFSVTFGHRCSLSAVVLVWLSGIAFILSGALVLLALKFILFLPCYCKFADQQKNFQFQPGTLMSCCAKKLMDHCTVLTHWGKVPPMGWKPLRERFRRVCSCENEGKCPRWMKGVKQAKTVKHAPLQMRNPWLATTVCHKLKAP